MNKNWIIIILAVIVASLIGGFWYYDHNKLKKASLEWKELYYVCKNAPADTVIHYDSIMIPGKTIIKPVPIKFIVYDTIIKEIRENWYSDVFKKDGIRFNYQAHTMGELLDLNFSDFVWPKETQYITKRTDTCINKPAPKRPIFLWGAYTGMNAWSFKEFPAIVIGGHTLIKEQLYIGLGGGYYKGFMGELRIGIFFNRNAKK